MRLRTALINSGVVIAMVVLGVTMKTVLGQEGGRGRGGAPGAPQAPLQMPSLSVPQIDVPVIAFDADDRFLKITPDQNFGETLAVAVNSKGDIVVLNHPGTATSGPVYGNATTNLMMFNSTGKFIKEVGKGVYGLAYGHSVRFDKYDNLWYVDKATNSVVKFNPEGYVTLNLGRRPEGYDSKDLEHASPAQKTNYGEGTFDGPTDVGWDQADNIYVSDGYINNRIAKFDKYGNFVKSWGSFGVGESQFRNPHSMQVDRQGNVYAADRGNGRIQVFDSNGTFKKYIWLNGTYDKKHHPTLAAVPANPPNAMAPWALCITQGPTQYLYAIGQEPGRLYKSTLDGKLLGQLGESGRQLKQFNWAHGLACPSDDVVLVADMNNWRVQKLTLRPTASQK